MIKAVSFDVDGTLATRRYPDLIWEEAIPTLYSLKKGLSFTEAKSFVTSEYAKIGDQRVEWYQIQYWFKRFGLNGYNELLDKYVGEISYHAEVTPTLEELCKKYVLVVISNAAQEFLNRTTKKIKKYFQHIFSASSDFKLTKNDPKVYLKACDTLKIKPGEMAHIGDNWIQDYQIPNQIGVRSFYIDRGGSRTGECIVKDLNEFCEKLSKIAEYSAPAS